MQIVQDQLLIRGLLQDSCTFLGRNLETWKSKKLNIVARSSIEAKFRAMS